MRPLNVVLLADRKDHGPQQHDYPRWQSRWALLLGGSAASAEKGANMFGADVEDPTAAQGARGVHVETAWQWPTASQWEKADLVVAFCYLKWDADRMVQLRRYLRRGSGLVIIHAATWTKPKASAEVAALVGVGGFERYRHGAMDLEIVQPAHPICAGLPATFRLEDESYWPPTPAPASDVRVLVGCKEQTNPNSPAVATEAMFWICERGKGRVFGCVPGHFDWTFDDPYFRLLVLRGMAWAAGETPYRFDDLATRGVPLR
jgi:type 1 glutamine amidotransferase